MHLDWLQIKRVRNLLDIKIEAEPRLNVITGENGSGKTATLEAIYLLSRARSFRTPKIQDVIKKGDETLQVTAGTTSTAAGKATLGIEKGRNQIILRNNGSTVKTVSEQAKNLPLALITPETHLLVTGTPRQRRHWLDWALFHVEQHYLEDWRDYFKALRQRNSLLKAGNRNQGLYEGWERTMAEAGVRLLTARQKFLKTLQEISNPLLNKVFYGEFKIRFNAGEYNNEDLFKAYLVNERAKDRVNGFTRNGPHRADLEFMFENERVAANFSRGQIKLFISLLILAEAKALYEASGEYPIILVDDYDAELDKKASEYLLSILCDLPFQVFLTSVNKSMPHIFSKDFARFHVEHGKVQKMIK